MYVCIFLLFDFTLMSKCFDYVHCYTTVHVFLHCPLIIFVITSNTLSPIVGSKTC